MGASLLLAAASHSSLIAGDWQRHRKLVNEGYPRCPADYPGTHPQSSQ